MGQLSIELGVESGRTEEEAASPSVPLERNPLALFALAQTLANGLLALPAGALGSVHSTRLSQALALDLVDLLRGATAATRPHGDRT